MEKGLKLILYLILILIIHLLFALLVKYFYNEILPKMQGRYPIDKKDELTLLNSFIVLIIISFILNILRYLIHGECK
jgi:hypothetical protein